MAKKSDYNKHDNRVRVLIVEGGDDSNESKDFFSFKGTKIL